MPRVFDLSSGKESDDESGVPGDGDALAGKPRKRAKIKPSPLENAGVRTAVTATLFIVVVASIAFLIFYFRPHGTGIAVEQNQETNPVVGGHTSDTLGPPMKDINPGALGAPKGRQQPR